jgi:uncharacterized membrane protein
MSKLLKVVAAALLVGYPFLVYFGLSWFDARGVALLLLALAAARLVCLGKAPRGAPLRQALLLPLAAVALIGIAVMISGAPDLLRFYPVAVNAGMLLLFGATLLHPPSMIERIARLSEPELPPEAVRYTRVVTEVWCGFFLVNGALALTTALLADLALWTLYNGVIAYVLMALLFLGELLVRRRVRRARPATAAAR